jgi:hypothetical protein
LQSWRKPSFCSAACAMTCQSASSEQSTLTPCCNPLCSSQAQLAANRFDMEAVHAAAAAAAAGAAAAAAGRPRAGGRVAFQAPPSFQGYHAADAARMQAPGAPAGHTQLQQQGAPHQAQRAFDAGQAMAQVLLSMPMPRWRAPGGSSGARRGLPAGLLQMREAVLGMQRVGLPPHLLFSDRDFTAGGCCGCRKYRSCRLLCGGRFAR